ncbi:MAG: tape measure protein, partial [Microcella sp.]
MSDRTVKVTLVAQAQGYIQGMSNAAKATSELGSEAQKLAQKKEAFQALGRSMLVVGGAITAVGVAALRTGIQYNTLQQTTRAALTTLLGSAEAANAQMDKLDDFARNSPFAKQTFIQAQQQMLGFGVEASKVLPALDAIQNAVAAFGGSNQQIAAIAEIMSRIKSEGRLSGDALQRLG